MYDKKAQLRNGAAASGDEVVATEEICPTCPPGEEQTEEKEGKEEDGGAVFFSVFKDLDISAEDLPDAAPNTPHKAEEEDLELHGTMDYIEHNIKDGYLEPPSSGTSSTPGTADEDSSPKL